MVFRRAVRALALLATVPAAALAQATTAGGDVVPAPLSAHDHGGATFDLGVHEYESDERVARYIKLFTGAGRADFVAALTRGTRYEEMIRGRLRAAGLPEDMRFLPVIESWYQPTAVSRVGAVGMWQFMAGTAREVGLRVDAWIDERRDPVRATDAAVRNLKWLRGQFGSMFLAAAAYNGGETRVSRGLAQLAADDSIRAEHVEHIEHVDSLAESPDSLDADSTSAPATVLLADQDPVAANDARYFALASAGYIKAETKNYVPQLIAALLVAKDTARYSIVVTPQPAFAYDSVRVSAMTPLAAVARAAHASRGEMLELNPHVLRGLTPPGASMLVRVPLGSAARTASALEDMPASERRAFRSFTTRKRELLDGLAERAGVSVKLLRRYNPSLTTVKKGKWKGRVIGGQTVRVPTRDVLAYALDAGPLPTVSEKNAVVATKTAAKTAPTKQAPARKAPVATKKAKRTKRA